MGGNDRLIGGLGADKMRGGAGDDRFIFATAAQSNPAAPDLIKDFDDSGNDRIELSQLFGGTLTFRGQNAFTGVNQVRVNDIAGADVLVEVNLSGNVAPELVIRLAGTAAASVAADDFVL